jgi:phosphatidylglycerophosphatase A
MREIPADNVVKCLGTVCGVGRLPVAPGTAGAAVGTALWALTTLTPFAILLQAALAVLIFALGTWAGTRYERLSGRHDPPEFVLDEVCGALITFMAVPFSWLILLCGLALHRFFDIAKPFPINWLQRVPAGWGIMLDDIGAGVAAWLILLVIRLHFC